MEEEEKKEDDDEQILLPNEQNLQKVSSFGNNKQNVQIEQKQLKQQGKVYGQTTKSIRVFWYYKDE